MLCFWHHGACNTIWICDGVHFTFVEKARDSEHAASLRAATHVGSNGYQLVTEAL